MLASATTMLTVFALTVTVGLRWRDLSEALRLTSENHRVRVAGDTKSTTDPLASGSLQAAGESGETGADEHPKVGAKPSSAMAKPDPGPSAEEVAASSSPSPKVPPDVTAPQVEAKVDPKVKSYDPDIDEPLEIAPSDRVAPSLRSMRDAEETTYDGGGHASQASAPAPSMSAMPSKADHWASYEDGRFGFTLEYPADVFVAAPSRPEEGKSFLSRDGRARLLVSAAPTKGVPLATHRQSLMEGVYVDAAYDYKPRGTTWYVLSGTLGTDMFYQRVTFSCDGRAFHTWKLVYPLSEREYYDRIVEAMNRRYRLIKVTGGGCG